MTDTRPETTSDLAAALRQRADRSLGYDSFFVEVAEHLEALQGQVALLTACGAEKDDLISRFTENAKDMTATAAEATDLIQTLQEDMGDLRDQVTVLQGAKRSLADALAGAQRSAVAHSQDAAKLRQALHVLLDEPAITVAEHADMNGELAELFEDEKPGCMPQSSMEAPSC